MSSLLRSSQPGHLSPVERGLLFASRNWLALFGLFFGLYVFLPFLAPLFMALGWQGAGRVIYFIYSFLCHQLPDRSYFFFGSHVSYSISEIQAAWGNSLDPIVLRGFTGNPEMGWKVAWSDRMVSMYTSIWFFGLIWASLRRRVKKLPWWGLVLFLLPMALDGTTHLLSDLQGYGSGFRDTNTWLAALTGNALPPSFYAGSAWGSFNAWMRLLCGVLFGLGIVWFGFPYLEEAFEETVRSIQAKERRLTSQYASLKERIPDWGD